MTTCRDAHPCVSFYITRIIYFIIHITRTCVSTRGLHQMYDMNIPNNCEL